MKNRVCYIRLFLSFLLLLLLSACVGGTGASQCSFGGDTLSVRHSTLLQMVDCDSFFVAEIKNPWREGVLHRYLLVPSDAAVPQNLPQGTLLRTPLERALLFSSVHVSLFENLGSSNSIKGVCDVAYMLSPLIKKRVAEGEVVDCGSSRDVDVERVVALSPDALFVFPFENGGYGKLEKMRYPIVECAEYMESSPLAAAEWVRFYGRLLGCAAKADSLFDAVCTRYEELSALVSGCEDRPTVMCELKSGSAWYVPTGGSTMGQMYRAAGADYLFADNEGSGSVPLSYEVVLSRAANADFWLFKYNSPVDKTRASLLDDFQGYAHFKPFKEGRVYACNSARKTVFEDSAFRPDMLLAELIAIFHPSLMEGYDLMYYEKVP